MKNSPRYQLFIFYKQYKILGFKISNLLGFLFLLSWLILFLLPFRIDLGIWLLISLLCFIISRIYSYNTFAYFLNGEYNKPKKLISLRNSRSLYQQVQEKPQFLYRLWFSIAFYILIDMFIIVAQFLQSKDSFLLGWPKIYTATFIIKYIITFMCLITYTFLYRKYIPKKEFYSPLGLEEKT